MDIFFFCVENEFHRAFVARSPIENARATRLGRSKSLYRSIPRVIGGYFLSEAASARAPSALRRARRLRRTRPLPRSRRRSRRRTRARKAPRRASRAPPLPEKCNGRRPGRPDATPPPRGGRRRPRRAPQTHPRRYQVQRRERPIRPERGRRPAGLGRLEAVPVRLSTSHHAEKHATRKSAPPRKSERLREL